MRLSNIIIRILLIILLPIKCWGVSDSLMVQIISIERQIMLAQSDTAKAFLLLEKSKLYKNASNYNEALVSLNRINSQVLNTAGMNTLHYEKAFNLFMLHEHNVALEEIWALTSEDSTRETRILYLMVLLETEHWEDFRREYMKQGRSSIDTIIFLREFKDPLLEDPEHYVKLAGVPGLGLMKSGYVGKGITSLSLQLLFAGFGVYQISTGFYATGVFSGIFPARRFYNGSKILTRSMVQKSNEEKKARLKETGYQFINRLYGF